MLLIGKQTGWKGWKKLCNIMNCGETRLCKQLWRTLKMFSIRATNEHQQVDPITLFVGYWKRKRFSVRPHWFVVECFVQKWFVKFVWWKTWKSTLSKRTQKSFVLFLLARFGGMVFQVITKDDPNRRVSTLDLHFTYIENSYLGVCVLFPKLWPTLKVSFQKSEMSIDWFFLFSARCPGFNIMWIGKKHTDGR